MNKNFMKASLYTVLITGVLPAFAANPVDLSKNNINVLKSFSSSNAPRSLANVNDPASAPGLQQISQATDFNQTLHVRVQQTFNGYPVDGGDAVIHVPHGRKSTSVRSLMAAPESASATMDGVMYQDLEKDLSDTPSYIFSPEQAQKAFAEALTQYQNQTGSMPQYTNPKTNLMVYVDAENKAHYAFRVSFYIAAQDNVPSLPVYIIDANNFHVYENWNDVKSLSESAQLEDVKGGGFGGNVKMGKLTYDGLQGNLSSLDMQRDNNKQLCYLQNSEVSVTDFRSSKIASFSCAAKDKEHNDLYWSADADHYKGGYSPNNDALYDGKIIKEMYQNWYKVPVLKDDAGKPMLLAMVTHAVMRDDLGQPVYDNAQWDPQTQKMYFGDGKELFYPLTSLGVGAHEISHGFTEQHSNLVYKGQSGGMNEAFSDMAAQAAEYYSNKNNTWTIGAEITLNKDWALRYMDQPSKDCETIRKGKACSIDDMSHYSADLDVHLISGIYNRMFYLISTSEGWDVKKAFDIMVQANSNYWTARSTFAKGACGVLKAAKDYKYDLETVKTAFNKVGVDISSCK